MRRVGLARPVHDEDLHRKFRDGVDPGTWQRIWDDQARSDGLVDAWWGLAGGRPGLRVLEVGCGPGRRALRYADLGAVVTAVDLSPDAVRFLESRRGARPVTTQVLDLETSVPEGRFDVAFVTDVLHHVARPARLLAHVRQVAAKVLVAEADPAGPGIEGPHPGHRLAPERVVAALREAGYARIRVERPMAFERYAVVAEG